MGCVPSSEAYRTFVVNEKRPGCGAEAAAAFKQMHIKQETLDGFYAAFCGMDVKRRGFVELPAFYRFMDIPPSQYGDRVFTLFDFGGDGLIDFRDFVVTVWNYCTLNSSALVRFAFMMYDEAATGMITMEQLKDMVRQMFGDRYTSNGRVMGIFAEVGFGEKLSYEKFEEVYKKYPYLLFPAFLMQEKIRRAVMGEAFWQAQYDERSKKGNAATYSVWELLAAMQAARVKTNGGEMAVAVKERYVPAHLKGNPAAAAAAEVSDDPRLKGQMRRAELGLPPAAGDADFVLGEQALKELQQSRGAQQQRGGDPSNNNNNNSGSSSDAKEGAGEAVSAAPNPISSSSSTQIKTLHGRTHQAAVLQVKGRGLDSATTTATTTIGGGMMKGRRGSKVANAQERAAMMAVGR